MRTWISIALASLIFLICSASVAVAGSDEIQGWTEAICRDKTHFEDCFDWSQSKCQSAANEAVRMCMFEILPSRPEVTGTLEEELQKKLGAGAWGVTLGHCGEVAVFYMNKERMNPRCESYFVQREEDLKKTPFIIDIDKLKQKAARLNQVRTVMIQQTVATVVFGLTVPLLIAFFWWRKKALLKFPKGFAMLLTVPSFVASFLGPAFLLNLVGKGISASGDNPSAIAGIMFGFMILIPAYWISIGLLFFAMKRTQSRAKTV